MENPFFRRIFSKGHPSSASMLTVKPDQGQRNTDLLTVKVSAGGSVETGVLPVQSMPNLAAAAAAAAGRRSQSPEEQGRNSELHAGASAFPPRGISYPPMSPKQQLKRQGKAVTTRDSEIITRPTSEQTGPRTHEPGISKRQQLISSGYIE